MAGRDGKWETKNGVRKFVTAKQLRARARKTDTQRVRRANRRAAAARPPRRGR